MINLKDYLGLPDNQVLRIKMQTSGEIIYGQLASIGTIKPYSPDFSVDNPNTASLSKINDFEAFEKDRDSYRDYSLVYLSVNEIDSIEIIYI